MSTPHNNAKLGDFAKTVIMPGDPLRAKYIAENFLDNYKLVSDVRNIYAYTGTYKGKEISVMASGMGMPSMGIYCYELYKVYGVENIIRIGSCGSYTPGLNLFDIVLSTTVYTEGNYALTLNNEDCHFVEANSELNDIILNKSKELNIDVVAGNTVCTDCFDLYMTDVNKFLERIPENFNPLSAEMEAFALLYTAKILGKKAACLLSVVDSKFIDTVATVEERQTGLKNMIELALEASLEI